jgi:hypothetical protein
MAETFGDVVRAVRQHASLAPALLCRQWVKQAWQDLTRRRIEWSWQRGEGEFLINVSKGGTCDLTRANATVSGGTLGYLTTDVDRQFRAGTGTPIYTIIEASSSFYILDRPYGGSTAALAQATVFDAYVTVPSDFARFIAVLDVANAWRLNHLMTEDELNARDPQRSYTGTSWALVARRYKTGGNATTVGLPQYELYPYQLAEKNYPFYYFKRADEITEELLLPGPLQGRSDVLISGAIAYAAEWPGTADLKNPYYNSGLSASKRSQFNNAADRLEVIDEEIYNTWLETVNFARFPLAPADADYARSHDVDAYDSMWSYP